MMMMMMMMKKRQLEMKYRSTKLEVDKEIFITHCKTIQEKLL